LRSWLASGCTDGDPRRTALTMMKKVRIVAVAVALVLGMTGVFFFLPARADRQLNPVLVPPPYQVSERAQRLHRTLLVADLHADSLLWDRDLLVKNTRGQVDIPRLVDGNVALQAFTIVTKVPRGLNYESNSDQSDTITLLAVLERWPVATWASLKERAVYQARRLNAIASRSQGKFVVIRTAADLRSYVAGRQQESGMTAGLLGVEGAHALEGDLANIDEFFDSGIRMMAPTHFIDNDIGGSAHGLQKRGLTAKGKEMIRRMQARHMIVDLAHASSKVFEDVLSLSTRPVVVSHTGVKGTCDNARNITDEQIRGIARTGGVIGIGYWERAVCGTDPKAIARAIRHAAEVGGVEHVALGSDYDGRVTVPFDTSGVGKVTEALIDAGFSDQEIRLVMGANVLRVLAETLPQPDLKNDK